MPSMLMRMKTRAKLKPCEVPSKIPRADSSASAVRTSACRIPGRGSSRAGRGGNPNEMEERDRNTVA